MQRSKIKETFQEFQRLKRIVDGSTLSPKDDTNAKIDLWNQVKLQHEQFEIYRKSGRELLTSEEQKDLDAVECARVLHTPMLRLRSRSRSTSSNKSRSREPSKSHSFEILTFPVDPSVLRMLSSTSTAANEARKRLRMEEEFEADWR